MSKYGLTVHGKIDTKQINEELKNLKVDPIDIKFNISGASQQFLEEMKSLQNINVKVKQSITEVKNAQESLNTSMSSTGDKTAKVSQEIEKARQKIDDFGISMNRSLSVEQINALDNMSAKFSELVGTDDIEKVKKLANEADRLIKDIRLDNKITLVDENDRRSLEQTIASMERLEKTKDRAFRRDEGLKKSLAEAKEEAIKLAENLDNASKSDVKNLKNDFSLLRNEINTTQNQAMTFRDMLDEAISKFSVWSIATVGYYKAIQGMKAMVDAVVEVDASLVELQKVTDLTDKALADFTDRAYDAASAIGHTGQELIDATSVFSRAGYALDDAFDLGEASLTMMNIGDGIDNVEQASEILISTMKGLGMEASDATHILDVFNNVSNNSAISFGDLADGMQRTAGVLKQGGNSIEEITGLLTGENESLAPCVW